MKHIKYRLNTLLDSHIAMDLKAYANLKKLTIAKAIEELLRKPLTQMFKKKRTAGKLNLEKIHAVTQEALKEYKEGKTVPIDDFKSFTEEVRKAAQ